MRWARAIHQLAVARLFFLLAVAPTVRPLFAFITTRSHVLTCFINSSSLFYLPKKNMMSSSISIHLVLCWRSQQKTVHVCLAVRCGGKFRSGSKSRNSNIHFLTSFTQFAYKSFSGHRWASNNTTRSWAISRRLCIVLFCSEPCRVGHIHVHIFGVRRTLVYFVNLHCNVLVLVERERKYDCQKSGWKRRCTADLIRPL